MKWLVTDKRDQRPRLLADRHYNRQTPGHPTVATAGGRAPEHAAGHCFREAGWSEFVHPGKGKRADVWLRAPSAYCQAVAA